MKKFVIISYSDYDYNSCSISEALSIESNMFNTYKDALEHAIELAHEIVKYNPVTVDNANNTVYVYDEDEVLVIAYVIKEIILEEEK